VRKRMVLFVIGLAVSAFPAFFFMFLISDITELVFAVEDRCGLVQVCSAVSFGFLLIAIV
jgi:hypothetical protein